MSYCIKVQENNVIKVTPKLPEHLTDKLLSIKGICYIEHPVNSDFSNVVIDLDYKKKVQLELRYLLCN
jgi:NADH:ubiquinone oxidoreductase subunit C